MIRLRVLLITTSIFSLVFLLAILESAMAVGIPGGDFRALAYDKGAGYALLSRYELFISPDGESWSPAGLDMSGDELLSVARGKNSFLAGTASGRIIRFTLGSAPVDLPKVKDPFGRIVAPVRMIATGPRGGDIIISSGQGVMISRNSGETFEPVTVPFWNDPSSREIRAVGYIGKTAMVFTRSGAYYSKGGEFLPSSEGLPVNLAPTAVFIENGRALSAFPKIGIFQTTNGKSWKKLVRTPDDPIAFLGTTGKGIIAAGPFSPMYLGDAKGKNWTKVVDISPGFTPVTTVKASRGALLVLRGKGLYRLEGGDLRPIPMPRSLASVSAQIQISGVTLAGTEGGVFRSSGGNIWEDVTPAGLGVPVTDFLQLSDDRILLSSRGLGGFVSRDEGRTWTQWNEGLGTSNSMRTLLMDGKVVLAGTENGLMYRTLEGKSLWQAAERGVPRETIFKLTKYDGRIWAASASGVYSGESGGPLSPVKGLRGSARDLSTDGKSLLALVGGHIYMIGAKGDLKEMDNVPAGASPTSVALVGGKAWVGTTAGVYTFSNGSWVKSWNREYEVKTVHQISRGVRVVTAGAGTFYLQ